MEFENFAKNLMCKVQLYLGNEFEVLQRTVTKNNGVNLTGFMAKKEGINAYPTIYIDDIYRYDITSEEIEYEAMKLANALRKAGLNKRFDIEAFECYEKISKSIAFKLIDAERNKDLLPDVPHRRFHNLAIVYYCMMDCEDLGNRGFILIRNEHLDMWNMEEESLYEDVLNNMDNLLPASMMNMKELIDEIAGKNIMEQECTMYVLTNEFKTFGAAVLLYKGFLEKVSKKIGGSFYILPSSVHEVIALPESSGTDVRAMLDVVTSVNAYELKEEEILADSVYFYDCDRAELEWIL